MELHTYWRSSAAYRVRIALNLKGLSADPRFVHLRRGEQLTESYRALNPAALVPILVDDEGQVLTQSLAIIEYLDEIHPHPPLLPPDPYLRAWVRSVAQAIACDIHPLNNLRVLEYLGRRLGQDEAGKSAWYRHWVETGFTALEVELQRAGRSGRFVLGDRPTLADACLVPQIHNARRFQVDMDAYPTLRRINGACLDLPAFAHAAPEAQPDAQ
ncbi:MAG TPA: maleylacetoacetate isomerase [Azospirillaceae bacterium]|nr:maleylacetoacetate isomerase [Azospirillaceae bacterium]